MSGEINELTVHVTVNGRRPNMRLLVLGPAFGLPSIDADCIAAVALLKVKAKPGSWTIHPTHEQTKRLPCLVTGNQIIEGIQNISDFISRQNFRSRDTSRYETSFCQPKYSSRYEGKDP